MVPEQLVRDTGAGRISLRRADITTLTVDAIVNAANSSLAGGGGVDGAIHRAAGAELMRELRERYSGCPTGSAVITGAGRLPAQYVIHAVGPRWGGGGNNETDLLASAYRTAFTLAADHSCVTVAAPAISTGIYGFPIEQAAPVAITEAITALEIPETTLREITFALFSDSDLAVFARAM